MWIRSATDRVVRTPSAGCRRGVPVVAVVGLAAADSPLKLWSPTARRRATVTRTGGTVVAISPTDVDIDSALLAVNLGRSAVLAGSRCVVVVMPLAAETPTPGTCASGQGGNGLPRRHAMGDGEVGVGRLGPAALSWRA